MQIPSGIGLKRGSAPSWLKPRKAATPPPPQSDAAVAATAVTAADEGKHGPLGIAAITWQKIIPLGFMFFCILFNYTILRDTKVSLAFLQAGNIQC